MGRKPLKLVNVTQWVKDGYCPDSHQRRLATESVMNLRVYPTGYA